MVDEPFDEPIAIPITWMEAMAETTAMEIRRILLCTVSMW